MPGGRARYGVEQEFAPPEHGPVLFYPPGDSGLAEDDGGAQDQQVVVPGLRWVFPEVEYRQAGCFSQLLSVLAGAPQFSGINDGGFHGR